MDDYIAARKIAAETLAGQPIEKISKRSGFQTEESILIVPFLNRTYRVEYPGFGFTDVSGASKDVPIQEQILILHYMIGESRENPQGSWVSYREIPGAAFYMSAFVQRAVNPLKKAFGNNIGAFRRAAESLCAKSVQEGDAAFEFHPFPRVPMRAILWEGDQEFPAEAAILFDNTINGILSPEDIAWMAGMVVYRMMAASRGPK
jgi:hypothetical protein